VSSFSVQAFRELRMSAAPHVAQKLRFTRPARADTHQPPWEEPLMMMLFQIVLLLLSAVKFVFARRANALERKYARLSKEVNATSRDCLFKEGNSAKYDPFQAAKRQYRLGVLVEKKDRLEAVQYRWAHRVERLNRVIAKLRGWKGRLVPYALGAVDVMTTMCTLDYFAHGDFIVVRQLVGLVTSQFSD
jgi:hypothetical protein